MGRPNTALGAAGLLAALLCVAAPPAWAGNTEHPRTPVLWPDAPCIQTVNRAVDPLFEFTYAIPAEDTLLSVDELEDSRTHQFVGFCRQWPAGQPPPRYISVYDLERAIEAGFEQVLQLGDPEATLETSAAWAGCWTRITADDARRPISFEAAAEPVVWDTSTIAAGTWLIAGYTWEPQYNLWSRAPWVVRVIDEDPPNQPVQAAVSMADTADALYFDESLEIPLCLDALAGSTVSLAWVSTEADPPVWSSIASTELVASGPQELSLPFVPPEPSWGATVLLRTTVEQPAGPAYAAHALAPLIVYKPSGSDTGDGDGDSEAGDSETTGDETGSDSTSDSDSGGDAPARSGRCSVAPEHGNLPLLLFGLGLLAWTRRRPCPASERLR
jgi:MYXO-CTERM domain-containing protein